MSQHFLSSSSISFLIIFKSNVRMILMLASRAEQADKRPVLNPHQTSLPSTGIANDHFVPSNAPLSSSVSSSCVLKAGFTTHRVTAYFFPEGFRSIHSLQATFRSADRDLECPRYILEIRVCDPQYLL
ncbi:hypothetical protein VTL71DRAFT_667 [Oculimacula yallundae]|uniref:Uncharacterized protein n=1 Tax=Oculimacula yallundae TaxID=86028 RepID=A0ABR4D313_9HELO